MLLKCWNCKKPVADVPDTTIFRGIAYCPECLSPDSELAMLAARWEAICDVLTGKTPSDFMESFSEVRQVYDLMVKQSGAE